MLADDPAAIAHQIGKEVEHLGFKRDQFGPAAQFAPLDIEHVIAKPENHRCPLARPERAFLNDFLRKRKAHGKPKSSASQSFPVCARASSHHRNAAAPRGIGLPAHIVRNSIWNETPEGIYMKNSQKSQPCNRLTASLGSGTLLIAVSAVVSVLLGVMEPGVAAAKNAKPTRSTTIALTPNERNVVVVNRLANSVSIIQVKDKNGNIVSNKLAEITVGEEPRCVAVHPSNRAAYVTNAISGTVSVVDLNRHTQVAEIPVGTEPRGCALTADGSLLYVANLTEGTVSIIVTSDPLNPISDGAVTVGGRPWAVAITDNGTGNISDDTVFVTDAFAEVIPNFSDPTFDGNGEARDQGKQGVVHAFPAGNGNPPITKITLAPLANSGFTANRIAPNNFCGAAAHSLIFCPDPNNINDPINTADPQGVFPNQLTSGLIRFNRLYLPNIGSQPEPPEFFNVNVQALVYNVDVNALSEVATEHVNLNNQIKVETAQPPPSLDRTFGNDLVAIDGNVAGDRFVIVSRGGNQIFRATLDASGQLNILNAGKTGVDCRLQTGNLPTGVAIRKDGTRAYADNEVNFSVTSMDTDNCLTLQLDISSSDPALAPAAASPSTISNRSGRSIPPIP